MFQYSLSVPHSTQHHLVLYINVLERLSTVLSLVEFTQALKQSNDEPGGEEEMGGLDIF